MKTAEECSKEILASRAALNAAIAAYDQAACGSDSTPADIEAARVAIANASSANLIAQREYTAAVA